MPIVAMVTAGAGDGAYGFILLAFLWVATLVAALFTGIIGVIAYSIKRRNRLLGFVVGAGITLLGIPFSLIVFWTNTNATSLVVFSTPLWGAVLSIFLMLYMVFRGKPDSAKTADKLAES